MTDCVYVTFACANHAFARKKSKKEVLSDALLNHTRNKQAPEKQQMWYVKNAIKPQKTSDHMQTVVERTWLIQAG